MKFSKELERELVPEWRAKYLEYKKGKKLIKHITRAIYKANSTPFSQRSVDLPLGIDQPAVSTTATTTTPAAATIAVTPGSTAPHNNNGQVGTWNAIAASPSSPLVPQNTPGAPFNRSAASVNELPSPISIPRPTEQDSLTGSDAQIQYGSFVLTPQKENPPFLSQSNTLDDVIAFALPEPAITLPPSDSAQSPRTHTANAQSGNREIPAQDTRTGDGSPSHHERSPLRRLLTLNKSSLKVLGPASQENASSPWGQVKARNDEFVSFLNEQLQKIEEFYEMKERQAGDRLQVLEYQLHEMRDRRIQELRQARLKPQAHGEGLPDVGRLVRPHDAKRLTESRRPPVWMDPSKAIDPLRAKVLRPGPNSRALQNMTETPNLMAQANYPDRPSGHAAPLTGPAHGHGNDGKRDYVRRPPGDHVSYRNAKRKLKLALQEFYRGLELLKSYALLNRTAFRKINKKYDKAVHPHTPYQFMASHVNKSWFVTSDVIDQHIHRVEDLYARYFERGNHKVALGKLRAKKGRANESSSAFRCGIMLGTGVVFGVEGVVQALTNIRNFPDPAAQADTSFLLQLYGGYFLMLYLLLLFCLDCRQWTRSKVNYPFIFEFDPRAHLDWIQLAEFPCFFTLLLGLMMWANFRLYGGPSFYLWWPVVLISLSVVIVFLPGRVWAHQGRRWFVYSHWRLLLAGLYPVEFRDFFLGDMYCSLTYAVGNVELLFCLYSRSWHEPFLCDSKHSRVLGFLTTVPAIWRFLQCIRRYYDTRNIFPHLVNCGKYVMTIVAAICLSLWRIERNNTNFALFLTFSIVNGFYTSFWDLFMDFSLMQAHSKNPFLRDILSFKRRWWYYGICVVDPILRFNWILLAIFTFDTRHSTIVSFLVGLAEVTRRGMWALFRVENEHSANVAAYKASRDTPLPYKLVNMEDSNEENDDDDDDDDDEDADDDKENDIENEAEIDAEKVAANVKREPVGHDNQRPDGITSKHQSLHKQANTSAPLKTDFSSGPSTSSSSQAREGSPATAIDTAAAGGALEAQPLSSPPLSPARPQRPGVLKSATTIGTTTKPKSKASTPSLRAVSTGLSRMLAEAHKQDFEKRRRPSSRAKHGGGALSLLGKVRSASFKGDHGGGCGGGDDVVDSVGDDDEDDDEDDENDEEGATDDELMVVEAMIDNAEALAWPSCRPDAAMREDLGRKKLDKGKRKAAGEGCKKEHEDTTKKKKKKKKKKNNNDNNIQEQEQEKEGGGRHN